MTIIKVSNIFAEVEWKEIKNIHLTIYPPMLVFMCLHLLE